MMWIKIWISEIINYSFNFIDLNQILKSFVNLWIVFESKLVSCVIFDLRFECECDCGDASRPTPQTAEFCANDEPERHQQRRTKANSATNRPHRRIALELDNASAHQSNINQVARILPIPRRCVNKSPSQMSPFARISAERNSLFWKQMILVNKLNK